MNRLREGREMRNTAICVAIACLLFASTVHRRCLGAEGPDLFEKSWAAASLPHRRVTLCSKVMELVQAIEVKEGQRVSRGDVLIKLDALKLERQKAVAEKNADFTARIQSAQAKSEHLAREFERKDKLGEFLSESKLDEARTDMELAKLEVQELQRQQELAKAGVDYYEALLRDYAIVSPIDGVVSNLMVETGEMVKEGQAVVEVIDPDTIEVRVHLPEGTLARIGNAQGTSVTFAAFPGEPAVPGEIHFISPDVDSSSGTFLVKILVEAKGSQLRPGLACQVRFAEGSGASATPSLEPAPAVRDST